jgi:hypothetical protein
MEMLKRAPLQAASSKCSLKVSFSRSSRIASAKSARIIPLDQKADYVVCFGFQGTAAPSGDDRSVQICRVKPNESVKFIRNPDYWKSGWPNFGCIEYTILHNPLDRDPRFQRCPQAA